MGFRFIGLPSLPAVVAGLALIAGLSGCEISTAGDISLMGGQEVLAQPDGIQGEVRGMATDEDVVFEIHRLERAQMYLLRIPAGASFYVEPVVSDGLAKLPTFAQDPDVVAVLNGGFFDPKNQQTASHVIANGQVLLDPNQNLDLISNTNVASYMAQILNRSEFRRYDCRGTERYGIDFHNGPVPAGCDRLDALGAGPQLLPTMTHQQEAFWDVVDGKVLRNPIGMTFPNARSAIGIEADGTVMLAMAAQLPPPTVPTPLPTARPIADGQPISVTLPSADVKREAPPWRSGVTLEEMADFLKSQGAVEALNLDGGSSSAMYYNRRTYYGRLNKQGQTIQRSIKSALVVRRRPTP